MYLSSAVNEQIEMSEPRRLPLVADKYLALFAWLVLLVVYLALMLLGKQSQVIEGMLATAFGALMMALQAGIRRMEESGRKRE